MIRDAAARFLGSGAALLLALVTLWINPRARADSLTAADAHGDAIRGKDLYQACQACHSLDENDLGPAHRGVVGRRAGSVPNYAYSSALQNSGITWDESTLDRWLRNPSALVPGTKMFYKIDDAQVRADVIAYLKQQK